jgi:antitoxin ParD1/3/4
MNVQLPPDLSRLVESKVESGQYSDANEVIREALELMEQRDEGRSLSLRQFHDHLDDSLAQADSGSLVEGEPFMQSLLAGLDAPKRKAG